MLSRLASIAGLIFTTCVHVFKKLFKHSRAFGPLHSRAPLRELDKYQCPPQTPPTPCRPWDAVVRMVATLDLNRLNHRSCFCGGFCIEEYYLPNLFYLLEKDRFTSGEAFDAAGGGRRDFLFAGTIASRDRVLRREVGRTKFAVKHRAHNDSCARSGIS